MINWITTIQSSDVPANRKEVEQPNGQSFERQDLTPSSAANDMLAAELQLVSS